MVTKQIPRVPAVAAVATNLSHILTSLPVVLGLFVALFTTYEILSHGSGDLHNDMTEAWAWGQELQRGYFKHPPFWAWLTFGWFQLFPLMDWAAYLFSAVNIAVGIYCVARCAAYFVADRRLQQVSAIVLILMPAYTFLAMKINANTILLSLWPAATWVFLRLMDKCKVTDALLLGLLSAFCVLSKYNSVLLLVCILLASLLHPQARRFWRSPLPFLVVAAGLPLVAMHVHWLWLFDFLPMQYLDGLRSSGTGRAILGASSFVIAEMLYASPAIGLLLLLGYWTGMHRRAFVLSGMNKVLLVLAFGPMLLTALAGVVLHTRSPALWGIQNLYLWPVLALQLVEFREIDTLCRRAAITVLGVLVLLVLAAPVVAYVIFKRGERAGVDPRSEVTRALTDWWHVTYHAPLRIVAGDESYALAATFYSADHPSYYISKLPIETPWITPERLSQGGLLFICTDEDAACKNEAQRVVPEPQNINTLSVAKFLYGVKGPVQAIRFYAVPPKGAAPVKP